MRYSNTNIILNLCPDENPRFSESQLFDLQFRPRRIPVVTVVSMLGTEFSCSVYSCVRANTRVLQAMMYLKRSKFQRQNNIKGNSKSSMGRRILISFQCKLML